MNTKKRMEIYKGPSKDEVKECIETNTEILHKKNNFYFVVRQDFDSYKRGDHIHDEKEIERIQKQNLLSLVMKINLIKE